MRIHGRIATVAIVAAGAALAATGSASAGSRHHLQMYKVERQVSLQPGLNPEQTLSCNGGDIATDGMWRIDQVDYNAQLDAATAPPGGWNLANGVTVLYATAFNPDPANVSTYRFSLRNNTTHQAQAKLFVTCLGSRTAPDTHSNDVQLSGSFHARNYVGGPGTVTSNPADIGCAPGEAFIAPSWSVDHGSAELFASLPTNDLAGWTYAFYAMEPGTEVSTGGRCLRLKTGAAAPGPHVHKLFAKKVTGPTEAFDRGNGIWDVQLSCGQHAKGLVGGFDVGNGGTWDNHGRWFLGMDPRIKARTFKVQGGGTGAFALVCFDDRTGEAI
ncbi:hypothetical protein [Capillimicrobium parvum]|uniref:Secreted protein n=1 Tax=Capillimicrobium parvum TaxID=2884022 RepID=A0A9E7C0W0_9ACTN|nr:hypothetical protein [Capillimicrobium parvum]UGS36796.1 hypothetical protein DSM104329_03207 [Capillimicrobium parvum]